MNWYKKCQNQQPQPQSQQPQSQQPQKLTGYKIVGWDGKRAYSIYDKRITYYLNIGSWVGTVFLGTSEQFCIDYYSGGTNDKDLLLTYSYDPQDIVSGGGENSEVRVNKARLESYKEV